LTVYDPAVDWVTNPPDEFPTSDVCPNIANPGYTISTGQKVESDGTLHIILCSTQGQLFSARSPTDAGYGIITPSGDISVMLNPFPSHVSGSGAKLTLNSDDDAYCEWRTPLGDGTGHMGAKYHDYSGILLQDWAWYNLNALVDDVDGDDNAYFADADLHDLMGLGKEELAFILLLDDNDFTFIDIQDSGDEAFLRASLDDLLLPFDSTGSYHWFGEIDRSSGATENFLLDVGLDVAAGPSPGLVNLSMDFILKAGTEIGGWGPGLDTTITYTADDVDLGSPNPIPLTTTATEAQRTIEFDPTPVPEQMIIPSMLELKPRL
jgi:hypothetical protein